MSIPMKCPYGKLTTIRNFGIIHADEPRKDICNPEKQTIKSCLVNSGVSSDIINRFKNQTESDQRKRTFLYSFTEQNIFGGESISDQTKIPE